MFKETPISISTKQASHHQMPTLAETPFSLMLILAYLHNYTPKRLADCRLLAPKHLRFLAQLINHPDDKIRSIRQHQKLASYLTMLHSAKFIQVAGKIITVQPTINTWFHAEPQTQLRQLRQLLEDENKWSQSIQQLHLQDIITPDVLCHLKQSMVNQQCALLNIDKEAIYQPAVWQKARKTDAWLLRIPSHLPLWLQFDLRQLGDWICETEVTFTPLTIATAVQRGYGRQTIQWLLETATQKPLPEAKSIQLHQWSQRAHTYQLRTAHLLSTAQSTHLAELLRRKQFRHAVIEQISSRHAIVQHTIIPQLENYLAKHSYPLSNNHKPINPPLETEAGSSWLALAILVKLGQLIPLPFPPPHSLLTQIESTLDPAQKTELEALANHFVQSIRDALHGRDTFLPANQSPAPQLLQQIEHAIFNQKTLSITYRALNALEPKEHLIEPHYLEKQGNLYYLHAYSSRAETNLTFRLDRILKLKTD